MKLHDLKPAPGAHKPKRRVGRGIAAGQGKTAGRGTKGQQARAGGNLPAWFEGGQTPLHQRIPKLHGFRNPFRVSYEVVNVGDIAQLVELGVLEPGEMSGSKAGRSGAGKAGKAGSAAPVTVIQEILRAAGLVRTLDRPMKVLGGGELSTALFVVADAFSASARSKIEAAGGTASVIEVPGTRTPALGLPSGSEAAEAAEAASGEPSTPTEPSTPAEAPAPETANPAAEASAAEVAKASSPEASSAEASSVESPAAEASAEGETAGAAKPSRRRKAAEPSEPA